MRTEYAEYLSSARRCDDVVGAVLDALDASGEADDTLVVFLSDNGMAFPFAKANCYLRSTLTPLVVRWPGVTRPGSVESDAFVNSLDLFPTFCDALHLDPPAGLDGTSLLPLIRHGQHAARERVPDLTTFARLGELGLVVVGQRLEPDRAVLECRVVAREDDPFCRARGAEGTVTRRSAHEPFGWRPVTLLVRVRRCRCAGCGHVWRQDTCLAAASRAMLSRAAVRWALIAWWSSIGPSPAWPRRWRSHGTPRTTPSWTSVSEYLIVGSRRLETGCGAIEADTPTSSGRIS